MANPVVPINGIYTRAAEPVFIVDANGQPVAVGGGGGGSTSTGSAGSPNAAVVTVQGIANATAIKIDKLRAKTSAVTTLTATTTGAAGNVLALNVNRLSYSIFNDSTATMYVLQGAGVASATSYSFQTQANGFYITDEWAGPVSAAWSAANGQARITECTP